LWTQCPKLNTPSLMPKAQCPKPLSWEKIQESGRAQYSGMRTGVNGRRGHAGQVTAMQAQGAGLKKPRVEREAGSGVRGWWMVGGGWCVETNGGRLRKRAVACHSLAQSNPKSKIQNPKSKIQNRECPWIPGTSEIVALKGRAGWLSRIVERTRKAFVRVPETPQNSNFTQQEEWVFLLGRSHPASAGLKTLLDPCFSRGGIASERLPPGFSRVEDVARPLL
jgi:hypothetical protein